MANIKISELDELQEVADQDLFVIVDSDENTTKKIQAGNLNIKGGDTLPIGAMVEYNGTIVPQGYEKVSDNNIIESGSNTNGNWIKYSDGTMICYNKKSMTEFTNQYYHGYTGNWMYPAEFVEYPTVIATINEWTTYDLTLKTRAGSTTAANVMYFVKNPANNTYTDNHFDGSINLIAIGKWK